MLACVMTCAGCASFRSGEGVAYDVDIDGAGWALSRSIRESTAIFQLKKHPPSTYGQLRHRMEKDQAIIEELLRSHGYYDGSVKLYLDEMSTPAQLEIKVYRGDPYEFGRVRVHFEGERDEALERIRFRIRKGQRVRAEAVFAEEERMLEEIQRRGYPFPSLAKRTVEVDRTNQQVHLTVRFDPGPSAFFGEVEIEGLEELKDQYILRQIPWNEGDEYDAREVRDFERKLLASGLFSSVSVGLKQQGADATNRIPVAIRVRERVKRTVRLGVSYSDLGPGAKAYWEHRNLLGGGEKLETELSWNPVETKGGATLTRAGFLDANQYLVLDLEASQEKPDAYDARRLTTRAMLLRDFTSSLQGGIGVGYKFSRVVQLSEDEHYAHIFFPLQAIFDTRNDRLNPVQGMQVFGRTSYYNDMRGSQSFFKTQLEAREYFMVWDRYRLSGALRMTLGSIDGAAIEAVPADERFYAGGGGSIRGYEYQQVGPKVNDVPTGGDKLVEFSAELRLQPGRRLGYAAFVDGGTVYNEYFKDADHTLNYGAGVGLRWFTGIGPLRADVAYPLNPNEGQVERVQFYISLGQAF